MMLFVAGVLLGLIPLFSKNIDSIGGMAVSMWRALIPSVILVGYILFSSSSKIRDNVAHVLRRPRAIFGICMYGFFTTSLVSTCYIMSLNYISIALSVTLVYTVSPIVALLIEWIYYKKPPSFMKIYYASLVICGIFIILKVAPWEFDTNFYIGFAFALVAGIGIVLYNYLSKGFDKSINEEVILSGAFVVSGILGVIYMMAIQIFFDSKIQFIPDNNLEIVHLLLLGVFATLIPYWLIQKVLRKSQISTYEVTLYFTLEPVISIVIGSLAFNETLSMIQNVGVFIVLTTILSMQKEQ
ncbi:MAG: EamA family transporter [Candidatus Absconditabacteria bacterium]